MTEPRLKSRLRVQAMLRAASVRGQFGAVLRRGDADGGAILVLLRTPSGLAAYSQIHGPDGRPGWLCGTGAAPVGQDQADAYVARRIESDPDLWVIELESGTDGAEPP